MWDDAQKQAFLALQFDAQDRHYRSHHPGARFDVIEREGEAIGRLTVARGGGEIRVLDIALLPAQRGAGVGSALLRELQREAMRDGRAISLQVERTNPARRFYERLGFRALDDDGVYVSMAWRAPGPPAQPNTAS